MEYSFWIGKQFKKLQFGDLKIHEAILIKKRDPEPQQRS